MMEDDWDNVDDCALKLNINAAPKIVENETKTNINEDEWDVPLVVTTAASAPAPPSTHSRVFTEDREPVILILVDLTVLSNGSIHNQFDKHRYKLYTIHRVSLCLTNVARIHP